MAKKLLNVRLTRDPVWSNLRIMLTVLLAAAIGGLSPAHADDLTIEVRSRAQLVEQLNRARPGTTIRLAPGTYQGGMHFANLHGSEDRPITLTAMDPDKWPVLAGGTNLIQLSNCSHIIIEQLLLRDATGNGLNIDDGGIIDSPSHHITIREVMITNIGPRGNRDGIKLSGVSDFLVEHCTLTDWGDGGSGIDMVGCHRGIIRYCSIYRNDEEALGTGVQAKGGTSEVRILANKFLNAGHRAVNIGGSTGRQFFRPALAERDNAEARDIEVAGNVFIGPGTPVAFVGVDGAHVHHNTMLHPSPWALRILQETVGEDFIACRDGVFEYNLIVFNRADLRTYANVGPNTRPETFVFRGNWWYCADEPDRSRPQLPTPEERGVYGRDPLVNEDGVTAEDSPAQRVGAHGWREAE